MGLDSGFGSQSVLVNRNRSSGDFSAIAGGANKTKFISKTDSLPQTFDLKAVEAKRLPDQAYCQLCEAPFTRTPLGSNPIRHCKRCAKAICKVCSENSRQLSIQDKEFHRVCDECDTKMDNYTIQQNHEEVIQAQTEKITAMNENIVELDNQKQQQEEKFQSDLRDLEDQLNLKTLKK